MDDRVATLTLSRPERRNAMSWELLVDLVSAVEAASTDPQVGAIVLTGAGRDFSVGADLARVASDRRSDQDSRTLRGRSRDDDVERLTFASKVAELIVSCRKPTVAKLNGACAGAGLSLALATDFRIAATRTVINTAFVSAGVSGDLGSAWLLARAVGDARARALLLDPMKMTADEALVAGILTEVSTDLDARVEALTYRLVRQPPTAIAFAKENLADAASLTFPDYLRQEIPRMVDSAASTDAREAARAFLQNRRVHPSGE
ncbi:enoyl-CoA hydratase-related protein [Nocardioidaceae bacterium SCSIO 66511]|nr:enoyl-CoA hydratase-related protein [Nocardioidaceae bacterium SCSIO 66511]